MGERGYIIPVPWYYRIRLNHEASTTCKVFGRPSRILFNFPRFYLFTPDMMGQLMAIMNNISSGCDYSYCQVWDISLLISFVRFWVVQLGDDHIYPQLPIWFSQNVIRPPMSGGKPFSNARSLRRLSLHRVYSGLNHESYVIAAATHRSNMLQYLKSQVGKFPQCWYNIRYC